jgi:sigma-B regulation protein RsbU (phosphoserine phosphatase)
LSETEPSSANDDLADLYDNAPCGYVTILPDGRIAKANPTLAGWLDIPVAELVGSKFRDRLSVPGRMLYETHLIPLLRMQGFITEIAVDLLTKATAKLPVFISANERRDEEGELVFTRLIVFQASERRSFERSLLQSRDQAFKGLADEKATSALREQFIAVLGHDLRNPLASVDAGMRMVAKDPLTRRQGQLIGMIQASTLRMSGLIDNVLDFARGQLGDGITLSRDSAKPLAPVVHQIVEELRAAHPDVTIEEVVAIDRPVDCDHSRIGQLLSNLLGNALTHGALDKPVSVRAETDRDDLLISVANAGAPIPAKAMEHLFRPFFRGDVRTSANGLGLGLHIASEIAKAHGGTLTVRSDDEETCFVFRMPLPPAA